MATEITVETEPETEAAPEPVTVEEAPSEVAVETAADASVEIARIEADRDITIAAIHADVDEAAIETQAANRSDEEWRQNIEARLSQQEANQQETLSILRSLKPASGPNLPVSESPEAMPDNREVPEPAAKPKPRHHRLI